MLKNKNSIYYVLFFILFGIFFVYNLFSLPKEMDEQSVFDVDVRLVEYKNNNNFSLEQIREVWSSITGSPSSECNIYVNIKSTPFYSLVRFYLLKLPIHPQVTFNIFNLIISILVFYSSYLLIKLLFDNITAIKSLIIMLSFYGLYTVTRFSGRGYMVIGLVFILFGCYFIWKSILSGKQHYLIYGGVFMGLSWNTGNNMTKLTPGFLLITLIFYIIHYLKQNKFSFKKIFDLVLNILLFSGFLIVTSVFVAKIIAYTFEVDTNFWSFLLNKEFRKDIPVTASFNVGFNEIFRRLRLFIFFPKFNDVINHMDEFFYNKALIPEFYVVFLILSIFYLKKNFRTSPLKFSYIAVFTLVPFALIFTLYPQWEIRYQLIFLPFLALLVVLGMQYYFEVLAIKIKKEIYRRIISGVIIIIVGVIFLSKIYNVTFGDYAKSWNNCQSMAGHRFTSDALKVMYKKYDKTMTLMQDFMYSEGICAYLGFDINHRYKMLGSCAPTTEDSISKFFDQYTKENGKVFIVVADGWHYGRLVGWYPNIKLELIKKIKLPKVRSFHGTGLSLYCVNGI